MLLSLHGLPEVLTPAEVWLLHGAILGLLLASVLALLGLFWPAKFASSPTMVVGGASAATLAAYFVMRFAADGVAPIANAFEVLVLIALATMLAFFVSMMARPRAALAAWVFPFAFLTVLTALFLAPHAGPGSAGGDELARLSNPLLIAHIVMIVLATALFLFAALVSMVYLLQDRALRLKRHNAVLQSLPSVETLRGMVVTGMGVGFPLLTASLVCGFIPVWHELDEWLANPLVISSLVMWVVFLAASVGRKTGFLRGRRVAWAVIAGFLMVVIAFFGTGFLPGKHSFSNRTDAGGGTR
jgi:HemX protein